MLRIGRGGIVMLALACALAGTRAFARPAAPADDATFVVLTVAADGRAVMLGTAFFVDANGTALTNSHVVYSARQKPDRYSLMAVVGREFYSATLVCANTLPYDPAAGRVVPSRDVAEIKLTPSRFRFGEYLLGEIQRTAHLIALPRFPALRLGENPAPGTPVRIVGYGLIGFPPIPGTRWTATGRVDEIGDVPDGTPAFRVESMNRPREGNSGSPVLDAVGRVAGMWTWNEEDNLAYGVAIASSALRRPCAAAQDARPVRADRPR